MLKYEQIAEDLRQEIRQGKYTSGDQLPLEKDMCEKYKVSRVTIKRAMDELVKQGLVTKRRGSGTFVKTLDDNYAKQLSISTGNQFSGFAETYKGRHISTKVLRFEIVHPSEEVAKKLQMSTQDFVYDIIRLRILDDVPMVIEYTMMPIQLVPGIRNEILEHSIYHHIEKTLKLNIQSAHRIVRAVRSTEMEQEQMQLAPNDPILEVEQVAFFSDGHPFEYSISHHRADKSEFSAISIR
ncbi:GntR family transcriptional regulator [Selenomonas ruminis]|uniref:GntR family transcriptional regulator n=1 Tax=Selenomonas ruminis TaxID=2593411 RepID=A0A5D6VYA9_9FIRM|nr:GntR family transcriptional regulator [Selenomonas sp. mPRGC5]TYZ20500.1 GntR family transcriptional regulator [Selenomonas sp. mPRGC5]